MPASALACMAMYCADAVLVADVISTRSGDAPLESTITTESTVDVTLRQLAFVVDGLNVVTDGVTRMGMLSSYRVATPEVVLGDIVVSAPDNPALCAGAV